MERERLAKSFRARIGSGHRPRAAHRAQRGRRALADGTVVPAQRALLSDSRRFAHRLPLAARFAALGGQGRLSLHSPARSVAELLRPVAACAKFAASSATATRAPRRSAPMPPPRRRNPPPSSRAHPCAPRPRNGVLYIFMPPARELEHYLELVAAVEAAAEALAQPIILEGYEPPRRSADRQFRMTPDPGVIEVNIHPSADWDELADRTTFLYEAARECRLTAEKFMLDGRHTGTGGGNHMVLGGATPGGFAVPAPPRLAAQLARLLAQPSVAVVSVLRIVHRTHFASAARGRSAQRFAVRAGTRVPPVSKARREHAAVAGGSVAAQSADRRLRQYPPHRVLHRQIVFSRRPDRTAWDCSKCARSRCRRTRA